MNDDKILIEALRRLSVQTGSIACLGCEYEYDCGIHGCAIICAARAGFWRPIQSGKIRR